MITGGAGLIGSHLADRLAALGAHEIVIYDDLSRGRAGNLDAARATGRVTLVEADIRDRGTLGRSMEGIDALFHLAAIRLTQCVEAPRLALEVMVDGTFNVVDCALEAGVAKLVYASSASIYGMADRFPTDETHPPYDNNTLYGAAKLFGEGLLRSTRERNGLDYVALRPFNVYGPRMDTEGAYTEVLVRWMDRIERGLPPIIFGDGVQSMDFVYVDDVARAFVLAAEADAPGEVFNIASGVETSLATLARALTAAMGASVAVEHGRSASSPRSRGAGRTRAARTSGSGSTRPYRSPTAWRDSSRGGERSRASARRPRPLPDRRERNRRRRRAVGARLVRRRSARPGAGISRARGARGVAAAPSAGRRAARALPRGRLPTTTRTSRSCTTSRAGTGTRVSGARSSRATSTSSARCWART
jgi:UDP-glucose 4-epimerase